jgi:hypothetical protein
MNNPQALYDFALEAAKIITFDQMILEYQRTTGFVCWIHVSYSYTTNRKHTFTMVDHKTFGTYPGPFQLVTA